MANNTFSIIIPVYSEASSNHHRSKTIVRMIESVVGQTYPHWELLLVEDGCSDGVTPQILDDWSSKDSRIKVIHQENQQRAVARNNGMRESVNDWILWGDSDDMFPRDALWIMNVGINQYPDFKAFFYGALLRYPDGFWIRNVFEPQEEGDGHEWFSAGHINTGSFVWHRSLMEDPENWIPDEINPYQFAASSKFDMRFSPTKQHIENPAGAFADGVYRHGLSLGNPWGDDFLQAYKITRHNKAKSINIPSYIIYPRGTEEDDFRQDI